MKPSTDDLKRYADNFLREQDGIALYRAMAKAEQDPARVEIFEKLAKAEEKHAARWARLLKTNGAQVPSYAPGWRVLLLGWLSRRFGTQHILPVVSGLESRDQDVYRGQAEAAGIPAEERGHMRTLRALQYHGQNRPESILDLEGWHRTNYGGSLRAAVFGANDGLLSNFSLVMGIAGATAQPRFVLLAGIAGLLAGASSMAAGEFVSVQSQRELYEQQSWRRRSCRIHKRRSTHSLAKNWDWIPHLSALPGSPPSVPSSLSRSAPQCRSFPTSS